MTTRQPAHGDPVLPVLLTVRVLRPASETTYSVATLVDWDLVRRTLGLQIGRDWVRRPPTERELALTLLRTPSEHSLEAVCAAASGLSAQEAAERDQTRRDDSYGKASGINRNAPGGDWNKSRR